MDIEITSDANAKLWAFIEHFPKQEVGGLGYAQFVDGVFTWYDTFVVPQTASAAAVNFTEAGLLFAVERAVKDDVLNTEGFTWVSWHSHHTMKPYWSQTDEAGIKDYASSGIKQLISFVGCVDHDYKCRIDCFDVMHHGIVIPQLTIDNQYVDWSMSDPLFRQVVADCMEFVQDPPPKQMTTSTNQQYQSQQKPKSTGKDEREFGDKLADALADADEIEDIAREFGLTWTEAKKCWDYMQEIDDSVEHDADLIVNGAGDVMANLGDGYDTMAWEAGK